MRPSQTSLACGTLGCLVWGTGSWDQADKGEGRLQAEKLELNVHAGARGLGACDEESPKEPAGGVLREAPLWVAGTGHLLGEGGRLCRGIWAGGQQEPGGGEGSAVGLLPLIASLLADPSCL